MHCTKYLHKSKTTKVPRQLKHILCSKVGALNPFTLSSIFFPYIFLKIFFAILVYTLHSSCIENWNGMCIPTQDLDQLFIFQRWKNGFSPEFHLYVRLLTKVDFNSMIITNWNRCAYMIYLQQILKDFARSFHQV